MTYIGTTTVLFSTSGLAAGVVRLFADVVVVVGVVAVVVAVGQSSVSPCPFRRRVVVAVSPSSVSPCPLRRRVVVDMDLTIPALPRFGAPTFRSGQISWQAADVQPPPVEDDPVEVLVGREHEDERVRLTRRGTKTAPFSTSG